MSMLYQADPHGRAPVPPENLFLVSVESRSFFRLMIWGYVTMFPMAALFITASALANSSAVFVVAVQYMVSIIVTSFALYAMRQVMTANVCTFPHGAGKLENFSAFLCGFFYVPSALYIIYDAAHRFVHAPEVGYLLAQIPMVISFARMVVLYRLARRMTGCTPNPSPLLRSYLLDYRIGLLSDFGVLMSFALGWVLVRLDLAAIGDRVDPLVALAIACYMMRVGVSLVRHNFRSLMDLPLAEKEQLAITRVLARHFADYDSMGALYTRSSGKRRFVEIELGFNDGQTVGHVHELSRRIELDLAAELPDLIFRIVSVTGLMPVVPSTPKLSSNSPAPSA